MKSKICFLLLNILLLVGSSFAQDTTPPACNITYSDADLYVRTGNVLTITVVFTEPLALSPLPKIMLSAPANITAQLVRNSDTEFQFTYYVATGSGKVSVSIADAYDLAGNAAVSEPVTGKYFIMDGASPKGSLSFEPAHGRIAAGKTLRIYTNWDEPLVENDNPKISLWYPVDLMNQQTTLVSNTKFYYDFIGTADNGIAEITFSGSSDLVGNPVNTQPLGINFITLDNIKPSYTLTTDDVDKRLQLNSTATVFILFSEDMDAAFVPILEVSKNGIISTNSAERISATEYKAIVSSGTTDGVMTFNIKNGYDLAGNACNVLPETNFELTSDSQQPKVTVNINDADLIVAPGQALTITLTFDEAIATDFPPVISLSSAVSYSNLAVQRISPTVFTYVYTVENVAGTVNIGVTGAKDLVGNPMLAAIGGPTQFSIDTDVPVGVLTYSDPDLIFGAAQNVRITAKFNKNIKPETPPVLTLSGTSVSLNLAMVKVSDTEYYADYTIPAANETVTVSFAQGADVSGLSLESVPGSGAQFKIDSEKPAYTFSFDKSAKLSANKKILIKVEFTETISSSSIPKINFSGLETLSATLTRISETKFEYEYTAPAGDGLVAFVVEDAFDQADNANVPNTTNAEIQIDNLAPNATLNLNDADKLLYSKQLTTAALIFTEAINENIPVEVSISPAGLNWQVTTKRKTATEYELSYTAPDVSGSYTFAITAGTDEAGNLASAGTLTNAQFNVDAEPFTCDALLTKNIIRLNQIDTITINFSKKLAATAIPELNLSGTKTVTGIKGIKKSDTQFVFYYTAGTENGDLYISVVKAFDLAGNEVNSTPATNRMFSVDNIIPSFYIQRNKPSGIYKAGETITLTAVFSEEMLKVPLPWLFVSSPFKIENDPMVRIAPNAWTYSFIAPTGNGTGTITIANFPKDLVGNKSGFEPGANRTISLDNTVPAGTVKLTKTSSKFKPEENIELTVTFTEKLHQNSIPKIAMSGTESFAAIALNKVNDSIFTYSFAAPKTNGLYVLNISEAYDRIENWQVENSISTMFSVDALPPSAIVAAAKTNYKAAEEVEFTVTFTEALSSTVAPELNIKYNETDTNLALTKITDTKYTALYTTPNQSVIITAKAISIVDVVGNTGTSLSTQILVDADAPIGNLICNDADALVHKNQAALFEVTFSEVLHSDSKPMLLLKNADNELQIQLVKVNDFVYNASYSDFIKSGNYTASLINFTDLVGNTGLQNPNGLQNIKVDADAPTVKTYTVTDNKTLFKAESFVKIELLFSENIATNSAVSVRFLEPSLLGLKYLQQFADDRFVFQFTTETLNSDLQLKFEGANDIAGNPMYEPFTLNITIDSKAPEYTITFDKPGYKAGDIITGNLVFSEKMDESFLYALASTKIINEANVTLNKISDMAYSTTQVAGQAEGSPSYELSNWYDLAGNAIIKTTFDATFYIDNTAPVINVTSIQADTAFLVWNVRLNSSEELSFFDKNVFELTNGTVENIIKISPTEFEIKVVPASNAITSFKLNTNQLADLVGNLNQIFKEISIFGVSEINTAPVASNMVFELAENAETGTLIGTVEASDSQNHTLTYEILSGNELKLFELNKTTGELMLANAAYLNFEAQPTHELTVKITDSGYNKLSTQIKITVELINEADLHPKPDADNVFSPNGDGINEFWVVRNVHEFAGCELVIFNSVGKVVFKTVNYDNTWSGQGLPADTYYFVFKCGGKITNKSYITIIK